MLFFGLIVTLVLHNASLRLLLIVPYILLETFVEFLDPSLYATEMEGLMALLAVPESAALVDRIVADDALLSAFGKGLD